MGSCPLFVFQGRFTAETERLERVRAVASRVAGSNGLEIFDVQLRRESIGTVLRVILGGDAERVHEELPWIELPRDLGPGEEHTFELPLRRPLGAATLQVSPALVSYGDAWESGWPRFEGAV